MITSINKTPRLLHQKLVVDAIPVNLGGLREGMFNVKAQELIV